MNIVNERPIPGPKRGGSLVGQKTPTRESRYVLVTMALAALIAATSCAEAPETGYEVSGLAWAGPTCPVETNPPDPGCAPRPVVDATVLAIADSGDTVESTTDENGGFSFVLAPGLYEIIAQPVEGLMGNPTPIEIEVLSEAIDLGVLLYDTGIR
jgi:hypothetical protein